MLRMLVLWVSAACAMERNATTARASTAADGNRSACQIEKATSTEQASKPKRPRLPSRKNRHSQIHARPRTAQTYSRLLIKKKQLSELCIARKNAVNSVLHTIAQSHAWRGGTRRFGSDGMLWMVLRHGANSASMKWR